MNTNAVELSQKPNNTWTNEFGDRIIFDDNMMRMTGIRSVDLKFAITFDGKYLQTVGGLKLAKSIVNKVRNSKCNWIGSRE